MKKIVTVIAFVAALAACKQNSPQADADIASVSKATSLTVDCVRSLDNGRSMSTRDHMTVEIKDKQVSFTRILLLKSGENTGSIHESFKGTINSVFDFNSVSKDSARVLLNPLTLTTIKSETREKSEKKLPYVLVEYANGALKITEHDAKKVFALSNCRTK
ncbi:MAG: hypothetical protein EBR09_00960 [Proteobacteria bacterium]|nr:hypothetical protein [Pseudomonadota bacterium]